jgi:hypothetical protein
MPNWCVNTLDVIVDATRVAEVEAVLLRVDRGYRAIDFSIVVPEPHGESSTDDCSRWRETNWGTKCNVDRDEVDVRRADIGDGSSVVLTFRFDTAWAPPTAWAEVVSERLPFATISLAYDEPGIDAAGYYVIAGGDVVTDDHGYSILAMLLNEDESTDQYAPTWTDRSLHAAMETHDRRPQ